MKVRNGFGSYEIYDGNDEDTNYVEDDYEP